MKVHEFITLARDLGRNWNVCSPLGFDVAVPAHDFTEDQVQLDLLLDQGAMSGKDPPEHTAYNQADIDRFSVCHSSEFAELIKAGSTCSGFKMTRMGLTRGTLLRCNHEVHLLFDF